MTIEAVVLPLNDIPDGLCQCGCGWKTNIVRHTRPEYGHIKGQPASFIHGHNNRGLRGQETSQWTGGLITRQGYVCVKTHGHPRADGGGYVLQHIVIAEKSIGRYILAPIEVHHVNERRDDNRNSNLVICENKAYHLLLHKRARAYRATGNPRALKCFICKQWDTEMHIDERGSSWHRECAIRRTVNWKLAKSSQQGGVSCLL